MKFNRINLLQLSVAAFVATALVFSATAPAQEAPKATKEKTVKKAAAKQAACNSLKEESGCSAREDCTWVDAVMDKKSGKEKRRAYCRAKPKAKPAKK
jgi:hypothetical protein